MSKIEKIAVLGAGTMGNGIVQVAAAAGYKTAMTDVEQRFLDNGNKMIEKSLGQMVKAGKLDESQADEIKSRIVSGIDRKQMVADADLVIEAIPENLALKIETFAALAEETGADTILASNTSELSVTAMGAASGRPDKVCGMHFFNPAPMMKLLELIRTVDTSDETMKTVNEVGEKMQKTMVVVRDSQGFVTTRAFAIQMVESIRIYEEGVAEAKDLDTAMKLGFNHPMGPLKLCDLVGLDVVLHVSEGLTKAFGDRFKAPQILVKLVEAGHLGRKTGRGFYDYSR
jgi:3-hydroxybutyryl-CoA dehydrogenase